MTTESLVKVHQKVDDRDQRELLSMLVSNLSPQQYSGSAASGGRDDHMINITSGPKFTVHVEW